MLELAGNLPEKENPMEELLKEALELFGEICDEENTNSPKWIWKGKVEYYLAESKLTPVAADGAYCDCDEFIRSRSYPATCANCGKPPRRRTIPLGTRL
jgi:hypothetical protein